MFYTVHHVHIGLCFVDTPNMTFTLPLVDLFALIKFGHLLSPGVIPKSTNAKHIETNIQVFDSEITEDDMIRMDNMNRNFHFCWDPTKVI